jgi:NADPH:quinone reductase-like Zn-dependent oxidoreductase
MKVLRFSRFGPPPVLAVEEIPKLVAQKGEVLIEEAASHTLERIP